MWQSVIKRRKGRCRNTVEMIAGAEGKCEEHLREV
jgi:hypothetical protein